MNTQTEKFEGSAESQEENTTDAASESSAEGTEGPIDIDADLSDLQAALEKAEQEAAEQREAMLRMHAEMENLRKRLIRDLERSQKRALEGIMNDLLPVLDSLEKGLEAAEVEASVDSLREGKALIKRMLEKAVTDHGLVVIDPQGEAFNPEEHEAMSMVPSPNHERDKVMDVIQKGYRLNDRLIRPARVVVSSGPPGN